VLYLRETNTFTSLESTATEYITGVMDAVAAGFITEAYVATRAGVYFTRTATPNVVVWAGTVTVEDEAPDATLFIFTALVDI
jgi:hypothetical protein